MFPIWIFVWEVPWNFAACLHHCLLHFFALTCCTAPGAFFHKFSFPMPYFVSIWFCMPLNCLGFCHILYFIVMPPIYFCYDGPMINVACCVICPLLPYLCYIPFVSIFSNLNSLPYWAYYLCIPHTMFPAWILVREVPWICSACLHHCLLLFICISMLHNSRCPLSQIFIHYAIFCINLVLHPINLF